MESRTRVIARERPAPGPPDVAKQWILAFARKTPENGERHADSIRRHPL